MFTKWIWVVCSSLVNIGVIELGSYSYMLSLKNGYETFSQLSFKSYMMKYLLSIGRSSFTTVLSTMLFSFFWS